MITVEDKNSLFVGLKQVKKAIRQNAAKAVYIARDCDPMLSESLESLCREAGISPEFVDSMSELGKECGIDVKASCACICK